jgi:NAD(P)H-flavin reductase
MLDLQGARTFPPEPLLPRPHRVSAVTVEAPSVVTLDMVPTDGDRPIRFRPGQIGMIGLPGVGEVPISFSSDPADTSMVSMTIRGVGAVTDALTGLQPDAAVGLRGPYGRAWPLGLTDDRDVLVIAGGLGMCPLRSLVTEAASRQGRLRSLSVLHGARTPSDLLFKVDLDAWRRRPEMKLFLTVDQPAADWTGEVGTVATLLDRAVVDPGNTLAMVCGPDVMLGVIGESLVTLGLGPGQVWVTMERNMKCAVGLCGHCQFGPFFLCKEGPVFGWEDVADLFRVSEV